MLQTLQLLVNNMNNINNGSLLLVFFTIAITVVVYVLKNINGIAKLIDLIYNAQNKKIQDALTCLKHDKLSEETYDLARNTIETTYFKKHTGIYEENQNIRSLLKSFHNQASINKITWRHIKNAKYYFQFNHGKLTIKKESGFDKFFLMVLKIIGFIILIAIGILLLIPSILLIMGIMIDKASFYLILETCTLLLILFIYLVIVMGPLLSIQQVRKELQKINNE